MSTNSSMWQMDWLESFLGTNVSHLPCVGHDTRPKDIVLIGEPCMVKRNSYNNVNELLKHIQTLTKDKEWSVAGSDGVPYILGHKLLGKDESLKSLLLLPGTGHVEMNVTKLLLRMLWPFGMLELAKLLGFKTPKALTYAQKAVDFHKAWEMLQVYLQAAVKLPTNYSPIRTPAYCSGCPGAHGYFGISQ